MSRKLKVLELYAGTRSISKAFERAGHETFSVEYDTQHLGIDLYDDVNNLTYERIIELFGVPDIIWASPDCTTYSIAGIHNHRTKEENTLSPKSEKAILSDQTVKHVLSILKEFYQKHQTLFFIENPRGGLRKMDFMQNLHRYTVTYCQYGDRRMKPTDIFSVSSKLHFKPICKNGDKCHVSAPRGSTTGTQGMKLIDKSRIPDNLCDHIVYLSEMYWKGIDHVK